MLEKKIIIYQIPTLFKILNEHNNYLSYKFINIENLEELKKEILNDTKSILLLKNKLPINIEQIVLTNFPFQLPFLIEKINLEFLKKNYKNQSNFTISNFNINSNSRIISYKDKNIKLTEKEILILLYLYKSKVPASVKKLEEEIWKHTSDLETHTVETHIYRIRKKIQETFKVNNFISNTNDEYKLNL